MSRLQEFKDTLAEVAEHLEMAEGYIDDALCDLEESSIGIKSDTSELLRVKDDVDMLWNKIIYLQEQASYK